MWWLVSSSSSSSDSPRGSYFGSYSTAAIGSSSRSPGGSYIGSYSTSESTIGSGFNTDYYPGTGDSGVISQRVRVTRNGTCCVGLIVVTITIILTVVVFRTLTHY